jgi:hypothetical protein
MTRDVDGRNDRDDAIDRAFGFLVDDDLEGFAIAASVDGDLKVMSFAPLDEGPEQYTDADVCRLPRNELLGKLLADFAVMYGQHPEDVADVATYVAVDHLGIDDDTIDTLHRRITAGESRA